LAKEAIAARHNWVRPLGDAPSESVQRERWFREVSTVAAYRDPLARRGSAPPRHGSGPGEPQTGGAAQEGAGCGERAKATSVNTMDQQTAPGLDVPVEIRQGVEL
jgi:hypothetical protein